MLRSQFLRHIAQTSEAPLALEVERAEGLYLCDPQGKAYMDLIAGIGVSSLGHRHPRVLEAVKEQIDRYWHTMVYGEYLLAPQIRLAELLAKQLPPGLSCAYFVNSGTEATEGAMKLAKRFTGRREIVACKNAYHGSTQGAASLMAPTTFTQAYFPLLPGIRHIEFNSVEDLDLITAQTACVIVETVQAECGIRKPEGDYLRHLRARCDQTGALLVFDEIQAAFGRTGTLFAFEQYGIAPDILLLAKGMGGGMPIGAFIASQEIMQTLSHNPPLGHLSTFGGHPVSCAAALATLQVLLDEPWIGQVRQKESLFRSLLQHRSIIELRSAGLWLAVELPDFAFVDAVVRSCLKKGLILDWFLFNERSIRIAPPLIISEDQIRWACATLVETMEEVSAGRGDF
ncbi:MAG: aspartate aminotransferase family protein [Saprospirales bacterium]|nr:aspartate aminotransferase family protein [Saprospirales bacterium]